MTGDWRPDAACGSTVDPDVFFPDERDEPTQAAARAVCAGCPVMAVCREYALARPGLKGIWGGLTDRERQDQRTRDYETARRARKAVMA